MKAGNRQSRKASVSRAENVSHGRAGYRIECEWGRISVLEGGGHISELMLNACAGVNPLWVPPWKTIDPQKYRTGRHSRTYGPLPDGRLLAGIAGHNLSFDYFGPPSKDEIAAGHSTHGEAPSLKWGSQSISNGSRPALTYGALLPGAQIQFTRELSADRRHPVIYCEETAVNLSTFDRPISWNEHVTFGPPFVEPKVTVFDMPATHAKACPPSYSSRPLIKPNVEFKWPRAPAIGGGSIDLRTIPEDRFEHYTAQLLDPKLKIGFTSACNPKLGLGIVYAFRRADFPWVGSWIERFQQSHAPWRSKTFCRGMEFSTTPFAIPRRETVEQNRLFGETVYRWLPAKSEAKVRFMILLFAVPKDFRGVRSVSISRGIARVTEAGVRPRRITLRARRFL